MNDGAAHLPLEHPSIIWRPLHSDDADCLTRLLSAVEQSEGVPYRTSRAEVEEVLSRATRWTGVAGYDPTDDTNMLAFGYVALAPNTANQAKCQGGVHPAARGTGIGSQLLEWQTEAGRALLKSTQAVGTARLAHTVHEKNREFLDVLGMLGYKWETSVVELRVPLSRWQGAGESPAFVEILPWEPGWDNPARRAFNSASAELAHQDSLSAAEWAELNSGMRREWSFVAVSREGDRPRVVGFISVGGYEQDWEALGWREGILQIAAAFDPSNRDQVLTALLETSIQALTAAGLDKISVTLDPIVDEATVKFYRDRGFEVSTLYHTYALELDEDADA